MNIAATRYTEECTRLVSALLLDVIDNSRQGDISLAESIGLDIDTINMLYKLKPEQLHSLSKTYIKSKVSSAAFGIDASTISNIINVAANESEMLDILDQYIIHGASKLMIEKFFGVRSTQFATRKRILGVTTNNKGRKKYISDNEKRDIYNAFTETDEQDERRRYLQVALKTNQSLHNVYVTIQEIQDIQLHQRATAAKLHTLKGSRKSLLSTQSNQTKRYA